MHWNSTRGLCHTQKHVWPTVSAEQKCWRKGDGAVKKRNMQDALGRDFRHWCNRFLCMVSHDNRSHYGALTASLGKGSDYRTLKNKLQYNLVLTKFRWVLYTLLLNLMQIKRTVVLYVLTTEWMQRETRPKLVVMYRRIRRETTATVQQLTLSGWTNGPADWQLFFVVRRFVHVGITPHRIWCIGTLKSSPTVKERVARGPLQNSEMMGNGIPGCVWRFLQQFKSSQLIENFCFSRCIGFLKVRHVMVHSVTSPPPFIWSNYPFILIILGRFMNWYLVQILSSCYQLLFR